MTAQCMWGRTITRCTLSTAVQARSDGTILRAGRCIPRLAIGADGIVYVGSFDNKVYAFNGSTGTLRWNYHYGRSGVDPLPAIGADGTVYVGSYDFNVYALTGAQALSDGATQRARR
jgi:outer membrane protein assembly factor BamB